jgi:mono/diheme cytochrome c family protein
MKLVGLSFAALLLVVTARPGAAADPNNGLRIAQRWCAECHLVSANQQKAQTDVMPFASIAQRKTAQEISAFLTDPHPKMPNMGLSRSEIADIVAYMKTLGSAPGDPVPAGPQEKLPGIPKSG